MSVLSGENVTASWLKYATAIFKGLGEVSFVSANPTVANSASAMHIVQSLPLCITGLSYPTPERFLPSFLKLFSGTDQTYRS
jgi:hypothetical protein